MITLAASLWSRIDAGEDTGEESGSRGENGGGDADELFPRYKQELWSVYVAVHAPLLPPFFFSLIPFPCSIERAVVTFEICREEERLGSKGRMI